MSEDLRPVLTDGPIVSSILNTLSATQTTLTGQQAEIRKVTEALQEVKVGFAQVSVDLKHMAEDMKLQRDHAERIAKIEARLDNLTTTIAANSANAKAALALAIPAVIGCAGLLLQVLTRH